MTYRTPIEVLREAEGLEARAAQLRRKAKRLHDCKHQWKKITVIIDSPTSYDSYAAKRQECKLCGKIEPASAKGTP